MKELFQAMKKVSQFLLPVLVAFVLIFPLANAMVHHQNVGSHADISCQYSGCDGHIPPPVSSCNNAQTAANIKTIYSPTTLQILGHLYLWHSNGSSPDFGCGSAWGAILNDGTDSTQCFYVYVAFVERTQYNTLAEGMLDSSPHLLCHKHWESTYMVGVAFLKGGCYYAHSDVQDPFGNVDGITNTNTF